MRGGGKRIKAAHITTFNNLKSIDMKKIFDKHPFWCCLAYGIFAFVSAALCADASTKTLGAVGLLLTAAMAFCVLQTATKDD